MFSHHWPLGALLSPSLLPKLDTQRLFPLFVGVNLAHVFSLQLPYLFRQNIFTHSAAVDISGFLSSVILLGYDSLLQFLLNSPGVSNSHLRIRFPSNQVIFLTNNYTQVLFLNFKTLIFWHQS